MAEGRVLKHCVGGKADSHVGGAVTILFLRNRKDPETPLCTIEMRGNEIVQIHGYRNDLEACKANPKKKNPRELYQEILEPWLAWLTAGSKRDKLGRPKLPKKAKEEADKAKDKLKRLEVKLKEAETKAQGAEAGVNAEVEELRRQLAMADPVTAEFKGLFAQAGQLVARLLELVAQAPENKRPNLTAAMEALGKQLCG